MAAPARTPVPTSKIHIIIVLPFSYPLKGILHHYTGG